MPKVVPAVPPKICPADWATERRERMADAERRKRDRLESTAVAQQHEAREAIEESTRRAKGYARFDINFNSPGPCVQPTPHMGKKPILSPAAPPATSERAIGLAPPPRRTALCSFCGQAQDSSPFCSETGRPHERNAESVPEEWKSDPPRRVPVSASGKLLSPKKPSGPPGMPQPQTQAPPPPAAPQAVDDRAQAFVVGDSSSGFRIPSRLLQKGGAPEPPPPTAAPAPTPGVVLEGASPTNLARAIEELARRKDDRTRGVPLHETEGKVKGKGAKPVAKGSPAPKAAPAAKGSPAVRAKGRPSAKKPAAVGRSGSASTKARGQPSLCVQKVEALAKKREERRAAQAAERCQREEENAAQGGKDPNRMIRRMVADYRSRLEAGKIPVASRPRTTDNHLVVCVRKRPMSRKEERQRAVDIATCTSPSSIVFHEPKVKYDLSQSLQNHTFSFDHVFSSMSTNQEIYETVLAPCLRRAPLKGDITVFAYGQTGSGKTYTMNALCSSAVRDVLRSASSLGLQVYVSAFEIYMGKVHDLLCNRQVVRMLEDASAETQVVGLTERFATTEAHVKEALDEAESVRTTGANAVHDGSSRSHAVVQLGIRGESKAGFLSRITLVDLAGSERAAETISDNSATRLEGAEINKSLLALKECIRALGGGASHVSFRGSLLTRALMPCFVGRNSRTIVLATVSPSSDNADHSLNTLRYAASMKDIKGI